MEHSYGIIRNGKAALVKVAMMMVMMLMAGSIVKAEKEVPIRVFRNYNAADGLADNSAQVIACTKTGRMVIATMGQINFYDGQRFQYIDPTDENTFPLEKYRGNYHLYFDKYHHIWLKNTGSVTCVELITERFVPSIEDVFAEFGVKERVMDLFVDRTGVVWLLTANGLYSVATKQYIKTRAGLNLQDLEVYKDKFLMLFYENGLMEMYDIAKGKRLTENRPYNDEMARHYASVDMGLALSGWETFGLSILESMASGNAQIGASTGAAFEHVTESGAGKVLQERTPHALAEAIVELYRSDMQAMKQKARAYAEKFSWNDCFGRQLDLYRKLYQEKRNS